MFNHIKFKTWFWVFLTYLLLPVPAKTEELLERHALVIANSHYPKILSDSNLFGPLQAPKQDAVLMTELLAELGFHIPEHYILLNANRSTIETKINQFTRGLPNNAITWIYFSGHGVEVDGINYLIPSGHSFNSAADIRHHAISANWLLEKMTEKIPQGVGLLTLDACRDNQLPMTRTKGLGIRVMAGMQPQGALVMYATNSGSIATGSNQGASVFTQSLVNNIRRLVDQPIELALKQTRTEVKQKTHYRQFPWEENGLYGKPFCLALSGCVDVEQLKKRRNQLIEQVRKLSGLSPKPTAGLLNIFHDKLRNDTLGPAMVMLPGGTFRMGDLQGGGHADEQPIHTITLAPFAIGQYEVTNAEYVTFLNAIGFEGVHKSWFQTQAEDSDSHIMLRKGSYQVTPGYTKHPIREISWYGARAYADWLSSQTGESYQLPSEAQWEYAARARKRIETRYGWDNRLPVCTKQADNGAQFNQCDKVTLPVGEFSANHFKLYDMHGNVREWVQDCWRSYDHNQIVPQDLDCKYRAVRGGSWNSDANNLRSAYRHWFTSDYQGNDVGFRLSRTPSEK